MRNKIVFIFLMSFTFGQDLNQISLQINDSNQASWWSKKNNNGLNPNYSYISFSFNKQFDEFGLFVSSYINKKSMILGESYINLHFSKSYNFKLGRYYRDFSSYLNDELSSGSMLISKNALPIPKIGFFGNFQVKKNIKYKFRYGISHSVLDKNDVYNESPFIHEKFLYLIKNDNNYEFGLGFVHEAVWAGGTFSDGKFPDSLDDYLKVLISADGDFIEGQPHANALGNHLGIWDIYYIKKNTKNSLKFYYQHFFEDTSGLRFQNRFDGLWGFEYQDLSSKFNFLLEYINTSNQNREPPYVNENYYNHSEYTLGWTYKGYVIGNPFVDNNPSKVMHAGFENNNMSNFKLKILLSKRIDTNDTLNFSLNFGKVLESLTTSFFVNGGKSKNIGLKIIYDI
tara:strand:- start:1876 stop:3069 length:1194 start_codon:yes stop_codon:yes gene_type:complete